MQGSQNSPAGSSKQAVAETDNILSGSWPNLRWSFADAAKDRAGASDFRPSKAAESRYERQLTNVAGQVGRIMRGSGTPEEIERKLKEYADLVEPWARQSAANMLAGVDRKNVQAWRGMAGKMGLDVRRLVDGPGIGQAVRDRIEENVRLVRSIPFEEAEKVAAMVRENLIAGSRAGDLAKRIAGESGASLARARTIAQTETSKAQTALTRARADSIGSSGYIWRTARDGDTRDSHRNMEGVFVPWDNPPTLDGMTGHAGEFPNCRCYPEPVVPREDTAGKRSGVYQPPLSTQAAESSAGSKTLYSKWEQEPTSHVIPHAPDAPLYNVDKSAFTPRKLTHYSMDSDAVNPDGTPNKKARAKAQSFADWLGMKKKHAPLVEKQIMAWLEHLPSIPKGTDRHGERFNVYVPVTGPNGKTVDVMTAWIYDKKENGKKIATTPRLINCFIDGNIDKEGRYNG